MPIVVVTVGYALFQTANNTAVMTNLRPDQRGVVSGLLNLSRNLGLVTGVGADVLRGITGQLMTVPPRFTINSKLSRQVLKRIETIEGGEVTGRAPSPWPSARW